MEHFCVHKGAFAPAEFDGIPGLDGGISQVPVIGGEGLCARHRGEDLLRLDGGNDLRQGAGVVGFGVVGNDVVDLSGVDDRADTGEHLIGKRSFHRVDEGDFLVDDEKGVIGRAPGSQITVEVPDVPI